MSYDDQLIRAGGECQGNGAKRSIVLLLGNGLHLGSVLKQGDVQSGAKIGDVGGGTGGRTTAHAERLQLKLTNAQNDVGVGGRTADHTAVLNVEDGFLTRSCQ